MKYYKLKLLTITGIITLLALIATLASFDLVDYKTTIAGTSAFATLITALFICLTLFEMQEQRKSTILPTLSIPKISDFNIVYEKEIDYGEFNYPETLDGGIQKISDSGKMAIYNLGCGCAKKITCSWFFDSKLFSEIINKYNLYGIEYHGHAISYWRGEKGSVKHPGVFILYGDYPNDLNFILPINQDQTPTFIYIPKSYLKMLGLYLNSISQSQGISNIHKDVPPLVLRISYEDIAGNKYSKTFKFSIFTTSFYKSKDQLQIVSGGFQLIEEINN
ncbi:hypothetical protein [Methanogenium sp. MK-MG]|uniref:hypothetical protein n=1 Tax=Methanogenium sp. MK-MG TaxID=2599926 RepID=UPI0013EC99C3|nr:hypothetical protein [Methanogenium sp. MK-MG]KAF1077949.1 hypothetical protein MKMG_01159 [Methanogenium sp. MK-MG]